MSEALLCISFRRSQWFERTTPVTFSLSIRRLLATDMIETQPVALSPKVQVVSVAPLFAEAIRRIHRREGISVLFSDTELPEDAP